MKKLLLLITISTALTSGLHAISKSDVSAKLNSADGMLRLNGLDPRESIATQQKVTTDWNNAVIMVKNFVAENSKVLGTPDSDLARFSSRLDQINNDFVNIIKIIRGSMENAPISRLLPIATEADKVRNDLRSKTFILSGKKESRDLLEALAVSLTSLPKQFYNELLAKKR